MLGPLDEDVPVAPEGAMLCCQLWVRLGTVPADISVSSGLKLVRLTSLPYMGHSPGATVGTVDARPADRPETGGAAALSIAVPTGSMANASPNRIKDKIPASLIFMCTPSYANNDKRRAL